MNGPSRLHIHDEDVRAVADLLAQRHSPGDAWKVLEDVVPAELSIILLCDAKAVVDLMRSRASARSQDDEQ